MLLQFSLTVALGAVSLVSAQDPYTITGFSISEGSAVPLRQNINELQSAGGAQWYVGSHVVVGFLANK